MGTKEISGGVEFGEDMTTIVVEVVA